MQGDGPKIRKSKYKLEFNPITGKFDLVNRPTKIIVNEFNAAGTLLMTYDHGSNSHIPMDPLVVVDNDGDVVVVDDRGNN